MVVDAIVPFMCQGAKHTVTGYDHILFLVGVIFFLYRLKDVVIYVSLFTIGHIITLLAGVLGGIHPNAYVIDAISSLACSWALTYRRTHSGLLRHAYLTNRLLMTSGFLLTGYQLSGYWLG